MGENDYKLIELVRPSGDNNPQSKVTPIPHSGDVPSGEKSQDLKPTMVLVDHFNVVGWPEMIADERLDVFGMRGKILFIENFVGEVIKDYDFQPIAENYKEILRRLEKSINLPPGFSDRVRVEKVFNFLKSLERSKNKRAELNRFIERTNKEAVKTQKDVALRGFINRGEEGGT